ncbi:hypothetical protein A3L04_03710 [Thermococcus chitonophagus]|uniref:Uncharacterized protein n=2 Tax=Thermococcus chitonophagus TaxID=54262 RepID=A0A2Z2NF07_9EURY|nr:hypothetical protein A3L04_03710 [Thermococcus chitonophagus]
MRQIFKNLWLGFLFYLLIVSLGVVSAQSWGSKKTTNVIDIQKLPEKGYATDKIVYINGHKVHAIVYHPGLEDLKVDALYKFAKRNGVDMNAFFKYLSEYAWEHGEVTYDEVKSLLIEFASKRGIDLVKIAKKEV